MGGYHDADDLTAEAWRGGYHHTGDIGSRDADGYITYVGRADDVFKASDYKISPFEVESALMLHESVVECAIVPSPDEVRGAVPKAYICLAAGWQADRHTTSRGVRAQSPDPERLPVGPDHRVRRTAAQDRVKQDPPGRVAEPRGRAGGRWRARGQYYDRDFR